MKFFALTTAALCSALMVGPVAAQTASPVLNEVGGLSDTQDWTIYTNTGLGDGCLASADFDDGTEIRFGVDNLTGHSYVAVFNEAWFDSINLKVADVSVDIDGETYEAVGTEVDKFGRFGAAAFFPTEAVLQEIAGRGILTFRQNDVILTTLKLDQATGAVAGIAECQAKQR